MYIQFFLPSATGRIEFSAKLLLSSSSGYSRNRESFFQSVSGYWQALLSALEGNATDCYSRSLKMNKRLVPEGPAPLSPSHSPATISVLDFPSLLHAWRITRLHIGGRSGTISFPSPRISLTCVFHRRKIRHE
jgi:hypothetical protein